MEVLADYLLFLAKAVTIVFAFGAIVALVANAVRHQRQGHNDRLDVQSLNERYEALSDAVIDTIADEPARKQRQKARKAEEKRRKKASKLGKSETRPKLFVIDFDGDIKASGTDALRHEVTAVLQTAEPGDEVLLRLESSGGMVHGYGLAASQLARLRDHGIRLTIAIDKVAASGGYMMACVADRICCAPFAIVGSIGVIAQLPNFNRLLREHNVDFELHTAGEYKRTLTMFGENTEEGRAKFREELEEVHGLFKRFIEQFRPQLDLNTVATGEHWFGTRAKELNLVDDVITSDDLLLKASREKALYRLEFHPRRSLQDRLTSAVDGAWRGALRSLRHDTGTTWD
ncbi:protease SohB [uncultured Abyssibacter sp.]|uniref:protease SohB n=1 Tax=uncultured Abyssibacter sp. TaxID=2320202 RepID=UPI0032B22DE3